MKNCFESSFLGLVEYNQSLQIQSNLWALAKNKNQLNIVGLHHPTVITLGKRLNQGLMDYSASKYPVIPVMRGGLATLHSEGQLVIYPILNLRLNNWGVKFFVSTLLKVTQKTLSDFGVSAYLDQQQIGLYTINGKIAFCGLEIKEGITQHGLSININNDLNLFNEIISCGVENLKTDNLLNYRSDVSLDLFFKVWVDNFKLTTIYCN